MIHGVQFRFQIFQGIHNIIYLYIKKYSFRGRMQNREIKLASWPVVYYYGSVTRRKCNGMSDVVIDRIDR